MCNIIVENLSDIRIVEPSKIEGCPIDIKLIESYIKDVESIDEKEDLIEKTIFFLKKQLHIDAIGIRLQEGNDYPYYTTLGFSHAFVKAENYLCRRDSDGNIIRNEEGKPILECLCGNIIAKRIDLNGECFTKRGSFLTIDGMEKSHTILNAINCAPRSRCFEEGYQSVAIIPLTYNNNIIGLLQMNHRQKDAFSKTLIQTAEEITDMLGDTLGGIIETEHERAIKKDIIAKNIRKIISELQFISKNMAKKYA